MLRRLSSRGFAAAFATILLIAFIAYVVRSTGSPPQTPGSPLELWPGTGPWAEEQLEVMTLEQKVAQLFSVRAYSHFQSIDDPEYRRLVQLVDDFGIGGVTFFQGAPLAQSALANDLQEHAEVPLLIAQDMEWGAGMRIEGSTSFPRAMAVGATRNRDLARNVGFVTAREARALGTHQVFAPVADVNNNPSNPIVNVRSFGQDAALVAEMVVAFVEGVQQGRAIATAKHFPGHGDTAVDSHAGRPVLRFGRDRLDRVELVPFRAAIQAGVKSIMVGHLALPEITGSADVPVTLSREITTELLREELGFDGLIVTDGLDMRGVTEQYGPGEIAVRAIQAGADQLVLSTDPYAARTALLRAVENEEISEARIDESVLRILKAKEWVGLPERLETDVDTARRHVARQEHLALSATIARESLTLLRNDDELLPLKPDPERHILRIALSDSDDPDRGRPFGAALETADGQFEARLIDMRSSRDDYEAALDAAQNADLVVVSAYLRVRAWSGRIGLSDRHRSFLNRLIGTGIPVALISFGSPYILSDLEPPAVYVAAYSETAVVQEAAAQAIFGHTGMRGHLPVAIPGHAEFGAGLETAQIAPRHGLPESIGMNGVRLLRVDSLLRAEIRTRSFPGAAASIGRDGVIVRQEGYGYFTYDAEHRVTPQSVFDIASLTKVAATTTAAMKLYEEDRLELDARVVDYLPEFRQAGKQNVTIRHLLTHSSGLHPYRPFHTMGYTTREEVIDHIMREELDFVPGTQSRYSDLGMITLMLVIEEITGQDFAVWTKEQIFEPLGMYQTGYRATGITDTTIVPTELDEAFREQLIQGEVHDETAWLLGGTSGHAGLFSTAEDLAKFAFMLVNDGRIYGHAYLRPETIELFTRAGDDVPGSVRALGWDTKSPNGYTSAGEHFGPRSFGHTGFTGTSLWIDPEEELFALLLTNRVYPTRENRRISQVRPAFHDLVHASIAGPPEPLLPLGRE